LTRSERSLIDEVVDGGNRRLQGLAAAGILPLPLEELIELQVRLLLGDDPEIVRQARASLDGHDPTLLVSFLRSEASPAVVEYYAEHGRLLPVVEAALQRRDIDPRLLERIAPAAGPDVQELLLLRQDVIVEHPRILDALESNPRLSRYADRLVGEYRRHLLTRPKPTVEEEAEALGEAEPAPEGADLEAGEPEAGEAEPGAEEGEEEVAFDEQTGLSEGEIRELPVATRTRLAVGASRTLRDILIRDPSPHVALAVLKSSPVTEAEIERFTSSRAVCEEVLIAIAEDRQWNRRYRIIQNLVRNPRTPPGIAIKFVSRLSVRDLGLLRFDRNVPDAVRQAARRLHEVRIH
jgi:hypothetical protein